MGKRPIRYPLKMENIGIELPLVQRAYDSVRSLREAGLYRVREHDRRVSLLSYYAAYEGNGRTFDITIRDIDIPEVIRVMVGIPCGIVKLKHTDGRNDGKIFSVEDLREISVRFIER